MTDLDHKIIKVLIDAGLGAAIAEQLAETIAELYKQERRQHMSEIGRKGGSTSTDKKKGFASLKERDPKRFAEVQKISKKKS